MPIDELIRAAESRRTEEQKSTKANPSDDPPKKTRFNSRQFER